MREFNEAIEHIERHLDAEIDIADLARRALTSEYHFRRMFSALAGVSLSGYIRRRRLSVAGGEVVSGDESLLDIAVRYRYGSSEAFARAFRAMHGVGPSEARRTQAALLSQQRLTFRLTIEGDSTMRYRVVEKGAFTIVGKKARVPLIHEGVNPHIAEFVRTIDDASYSRLAELSDGEPGGVLAVCADLDPDRAEGSELDYYQGVATSREAPADLDVLSVPAGTWAVFESSGEHPRVLQEMWRDVFTQWFPSHSFRSAPGPELLRADVSDDYTHADCEVWLPVEKTSS